jgi:hypothetical protein
MNKIEIKELSPRMEITKKVQKDNGNYRIEGFAPVYENDKKVGKLEIVIFNINLDNGLLSPDEEGRYYEVSKRLD